MVKCGRRVGCGVGLVTLPVEHVLDALAVVVIEIQDNHTAEHEQQRNECDDSSNVSRGGFLVRRFVVGLGVGHLRDVWLFLGGLCDGTHWSERWGRSSLAYRNVCTSTELFLGSTTNTLCVIVALSPVISGHVDPL